MPFRLFLRKCSTDLKENLILSYCGNIWKVMRFFMIFNSMAFAVFLPTIFILYWICPAKYRYIFLLAASFYFYMAMDKRYALLLLSIAIVSFFLALALQSAASLPDKGWDRDRKRCLLKKIYLLAGIILLAGCLILLK